MAKPKPDKDLLAALTLSGGTSTKKSGAEEDDAEPTAEDGEDDAFPDDAEAKGAALTEFRDAMEEGDTAGAVTAMESFLELCGYRKG